MISKPLILVFVFVISNILKVNAYESCIIGILHTSCSDFCCQSNFGSNYCCSDCTKSTNLNACMFTVTSNIPTIIGSVVGAIIVITIISIIICVCCGCICAGRTGIQRPGYVVNRPQATVIGTVTSPYPPVQPAYPQGQVFSPNVGYPPPAYPQYPPASGNPPPYNPSFVQDKP